MYIPYLSYYTGEGGKETTDIEILSWTKIKDGIKRTENVFLNKSLYAPIYIDSISVRINYKSNIKSFKKTCRQQNKSNINKNKINIAKWV